MEARFRTTNIALAAVGITLCTASLAMRIYTKARLLRNFWWDDVFIILAWIFSLATQAILLAGYDHAGYGQHVWDVTSAQLEVFFKTILAVSILYVPALALAKLALLMLYYTLLHHITTIWKYLIYALAFIIVGYSIALVLSLIFACSPIAKAWDLSITTGSCVNQNALYLATAVTNTASDFALLFIPVPIVRGLRLPFTQRVGVALIFGIGGITTIMSVVRVATLMSQISTPDKPWGFAAAQVLIIIEANLIILCGCLIFLRQFLRRHAPRFVKRINRTGMWMYKFYAGRSLSESEDRQPDGATVQEIRPDRDRDRDRADVEQGSVPSWGVAARRSGGLEEGVYIPP